MTTRSHRKSGRATLAAIVVGVTAGCGSGDDTAAPAPESATGEAVTLQLSEERGSGQTGTATLKPGSGTTFEVVLEVSRSREHTTHPAHIHQGTCAEYRSLTDFDAQLATVVDELQDVVDGRSESTVYTARLDERTNGGYSINVHEPTHPYDVVACGDIR